MFLFFAGAEAAFALLTGAGLFAGILRAFDAFLLAPPRAGAAPFLGADELFAELAGLFVEVLFPAGFLAGDVFFALDFLVDRPFAAAVREGLAFLAVLRLFDAADFEAVLFFTLLREALFAEDLDGFRDGAFAAVRLEPAELRFTALFLAGFAAERFIGLLFLEAVAFPFEAVGLRAGALFFTALFFTAPFFTPLFLAAVFGAGLRDGALFLLELFVDPPRAVTDLEELFLDVAIATPFYRSEGTAFNSVFDCSRTKTITPPSPLASAA